MSGFRRRLLAQAATKQYIEGYCNVYNSTYSFSPTLSGTQETVTVNTDANGYWRWYMPAGKYASDMNGAFSTVSQSESDKLVTIDFTHLDCSRVSQWYSTFGERGSSSYANTNLVSVKGMGVSLNGGHYAFTSTFTSCSSLEYVDVSRWIMETDGVSVGNLFQGCSNLTTLYGQDSWSLKVCNMITAFYNCSSLVSLDLTNWRTFDYGRSNVFSETFTSCSSLQSLLWSNLDFSIFQSLGSFYGSFLNCSSLTSLDLSPLNGTQPTSISYMFSGCVLPIINLSMIDLSNCPNVTDAFYGSNVEEIYFGTQNITPKVNFRYMAARCSELRVCDMSGVTARASYINHIFSSCYVLEEIDLSGIDTTQMNSGASFNFFVSFNYELETIKLPAIPSGASVNETFSRDSSLTNILSCGPISTENVNIKFDDCPLTLQSAIVILNALQDLNGDTSTVTFSSSTLALVQASINNGDVDTISAVTNAIDNGWTITGF